MKGTLKVTASGGKNPGAKLKPMSKLAPKSSKRPMTRTDKEISDMADHSIEQGIKYKAKGSKVSEYGGKETYKSKAAMKKHESKESPKVEAKERKMASGGSVTRKMSGGDILGTISPLAGAITGKGLFGKLVKSGGPLGLAATLRNDAKKKQSSATTAGMKSGGSVNKKMGGGAMHKMPDGTMMPGKSHGMKSGGTMKMRGAGAATKGTKFYRNG